MAMTRRLGDGWTLTDGIMDPFLLSRPMEVTQALQIQGVLQGAVGGSELRMQEWTRLRTFTYACKFDAPEEDDELASLHFPLLAGNGWIKLNGHICWRFEGTGVHFPIPGNMKERDNLLEVSFEPDPDGLPRGIIGDVFLRTGNYLYLNSARFSGHGQTIQCQLRVSAFTSGKYVFKYTIALDDNLPVNIEFVERLRALSERTEIHHELHVPGATLWDPSNPDDTSYTLKLSIERMGVGCEQVVAHVAMLPDGYAPTRFVSLHPALLQPGDVRERVLTNLRELGAEAVVIAEAPTEPAQWKRQLICDGHEFIPDPQLFLENLLPYGLLALDETDAEALPVSYALAPLDTLQRLGADWAIWPMDRPLYRWFGIPPMDKDAYEARFGVNATGDAGRCSRMSRMLQAERLYRAACEARLSGTKMRLAHPIECAPAPASDALIEADMTQRPACQAIEAAWAQQCAYARLPESMAAPHGCALDIPVFLMSDAPTRPLCVTASVFGQDEKSKLASQTFESAACGEVGRIQFTMPNETQAMTVRCEIQSGGALLWRRDSVLCAHALGEPPMAAMMKL